jgi:hypothetical protein
MGFTTLVSGFFFDTARDVLKEVVKSAIEKKMEKVAQQQVRETLLDYLQKQKPSQETHIHIDIETIDILLQEIYAIANKSQGISVDKEIIQIKPEPLIKIPETVREMKLNQKVKSLRSGLLEITQLDTQNDETIAAQPVPSEMPLIFGSEQDATETPETPKDISNIVNNYKNKIQSALQEDDKE